MLLALLALYRRRLFSTGYKNTIKLVRTSWIPNQTALLTCSNHLFFVEVDMGYAVQNFVHSCAAYSVASYVLGIGDRHNDNVMITREGHIFRMLFNSIAVNVCNIPFS